MKMKNKLDIINSFPIILQERINRRFLLYPTCEHYTILLNAACLIFRIKENEARNKYGNFMYEDWNGLLKSYLLV